MDQEEEGVREMRRRRKRKGIYKSTAKARGKA
jgi:hypothetical protein